MGVIQRYLFVRAAKVFLAAMGATLGIVWISQALRFVDLVTSSGQTALTFFTVATLIIPQLIPEVLPFAVAMAVAHTFAAMNRDSELVVINAAGASRRVIIVPMVLLGLLASLASFFSANVVDAYAKVRFKELVASARADMISLVLQEGTFRQVEPGLYIQIAEQLPGGELGGVFVADSRKDDVDLIYYARSGIVTNTIAGELMVLRDGEIHRKRPAGDVSIVRFDAYALDMAMFGPASDGGVTMFPKDRTLLFLMNPDPNDRVYKDIPAQFRAELHRRLADWIYPLVFALIGLAVAGDARSHRESRISPVASAVLFALLARWLGFSMVGLAGKPGATVLGIYAVPAAFSLLSIWCLATNRLLELPHKWVEALAERLRRLSNGAAGLLGLRRTAPADGEAA